MNSQRTRPVAALVVVGGLGFLAPVALGGIPPVGSVSNPVAPVPVNPGTGLNGEIWDASVGSLSGALAEIASGVVDGGFTAATIDYPNGAVDDIDTPTPLATFLGTDGASLSGTSVSEGFSLVMRMSGLIAIERAGVVQFAVGSDDGFRLTIGVALVSEFTNNRAFGFSSAALNFEEPGLYPIELVYYANSEARSGLEFYSSIPGGVDSGAPASGLSIVPTGVLYVPTPGATALAAGALLLVLGQRRR